MDAVPATDGFLKAFLAEFEFVESEFAFELFGPSNQEKNEVPFEVVSSRRLPSRNLTEKGLKNVKFREMTK